MNFISVKEAAANWGVHIRVVQSYCQAERIPGAKKLGRVWLIPVGADKPGDPRRFPTATDKGGEICPCQTPLLNISSLYPAPGSAQAAIAALAATPGAQGLFAAQLAYGQGDIQRAYRGALALLGETSCFEVQVGTGILLSLCAMYQGDVALWRQARQHIMCTPIHNKAEQERLAFWLAATDSAIYDNAGFPADFCRGCFDFLPADSFAAARFFYVKYLYVEINNCVRERNQSGNSPRYDSLFQAWPSICELLISQTRAEGALMSEIYLRLLCAIAYHNAGENHLAAAHIDRALALALPDKLYSPLAEYRQPLDSLLDERLSSIDPVAHKEIKELHTQLMEGWVKLHNTLLQRHFFKDLTTREREISRLAVFGLTNADIAQRLSISLATVKQTLRNAMDKTGAQSRCELVEYL